VVVAVTQRPVMKFSGELYPRSVAGQAPHGIQVQNGEAGVQGGSRRAQQVVETAPAVAGRRRRHKFAVAGNAVGTQAGTGPGAGRTQKQ